MANTPEQNGYQRAWYKRNKEAHVARVCRRRREVVVENKARLLSYLKEHPCIDCGESDPVVLTFDHVEGKKEAAVCDMVRNGSSWSTILTEIAKCAVRCFNCHMRKTARERGWFKNLRL